MLWGLIMEPGRRYTQEVEKSFHVSMACLDFSTSNNDPVQVMLGYQGRNYLLCSLQKPNLLQCPLNLNFKAGTQISFATNGKGHVHLTGYLTNNVLDFDLDGDEEEEEDEIEEEELANMKGKKRVAKSLKNGQPAKKSKSGADIQRDQSSDDEDDDDAVFDDEGDDDSDEENATLEELEEEGDEEGEEEEEDDSDEGQDEDDGNASSLSEEELESPVKGKAKKQQQPQTNGVAVKKENAQQQKKNQKAAPEEPKKLGKKTLQGGVIVEDIQEGQGQAAKNGKVVNVFYEGRLKSNNKMFDSLKKGAGFNFRLGTKEVIRGWDIGVVGMRPGGKRRIICPPSMAYGARGSPPTIPPNSTLVFEVEMRKIR